MTSFVTPGFNPEGKDHNVSRSAIGTTRRNQGKPDVSNRVVPVCTRVLHVNVPGDQINFFSKYFRINSVNSLNKMGFDR